MPFCTQVVYSHPTMAQFSVVRVASKEAKETKLEEAREILHFPFL